MGHSIIMVQKMATCVHICGKKFKIKEGNQKKLCQHSRVHLIIRILKDWKNAQYDKLCDSANLKN